MAPSSWSSAVVEFTATTMVPSSPISTGETRVPSGSPCGSTRVMTGTGPAQAVAAKMPTTAINVVFNVLTPSLAIARAGSGRSFATREPQRPVRLPRPRVLSNGRTHGHALIRIKTPSLTTLGPSRAGAQEGPGARSEASTPAVPRVTARGSNSNVAYGRTCSVRAAHLPQSGTAVQSHSRTCQSAIDTPGRDLARNQPHWSR